VRRQAPLELRTRLASCGLAACALAPAFRESAASPSAVDQQSQQINVFLVTAARWLPDRRGTSRRQRVVA